VPLRLCDHIKPDGHRCGSPAMRGRSRCYFHLRPRSAALRRRFRLPDLTNKRSLRSALNHISQGMADGSLDPLLAGRLIYAVQTVLYSFNIEERLNNNTAADRSPSQVPSS